MNALRNALMLLSLLLGAPPPRLAGRALANGLIRLDQPAREVRKQLKRHADKRSASYAVASVALTTRP